MLVNVLLSLVSAWIICGVLMFLFFTRLLKRVEEQAEESPELIPELLHIYAVLEDLGPAALIAACLVFWPWAIASMVKKWRED